MSETWTSPEAETIAAELARCVLGGRGPRRPEQRMDAMGAVSRAFVAHRLMVIDIGRALMPAVRRIVEFMQANPQIQAHIENREESA